MLKGKRKQSEETNQEWHLDPDMTQTLESLHREFKVTVINMLSALMEKAENMQVWMEMKDESSTKKSKGKARN